MAARSSVKTAATASWIDLSTSELWPIYQEQQSEEVKNELVERHAALVRYVAERICATLPKSVDVDDLVQEGTLGLMDAITKFDPGRGVKFKTYCSNRVRGAILDALRSQDWVPRLVRQRASKLEQLRGSWLTRHGREPTLTELAKGLQVEEEEVDRELNKAAPRAILHVSDRRLPATEEGEGQIDSLAPSPEEDPADRVHRKDLMEVLTSSLTPKEQRILVLYYQRGLTLREIGLRLQLTESRVCQIHSNVVKRLRQRLAPTADQFTA